MKIKDSLLTSEEIDTINKYISFVDSIESIEFMMKETEERVKKIMDKNSIDTLECDDRVIKLHHVMKGIIHDEKRLIDILRLKNKEYLLLHSVSVDTDSLCAEVDNGDIENIESQFTVLKSEILTCEHNTC